MRIEGLPTVLPFHRALLEAQDFLAEEGAESFRVHTRWIETEFEEELAESEHLAAALRHQEQGMRRSTVEIDGRAVSLGLPGELLGLLGSSAAATPEASGSAAAPHDGAVTSPVAGALVSWEAEEGAAVEEGEALVVVEAMKMESTVRAPRAGTFSREALEPGDSLSTGQVLGRLA